MKILFFVVFLLLSNIGYAENLNDALDRIESEWAIVYYKTPQTQQAEAYTQLLNKAVTLAKQHPNAAEPLFWQALVKSSHAAHLDAFSALTAIKESRELLTRVITINPTAMNGSAHVTLGTLYYMVPKWPIAFGDNDEAKKLLETALAINPNGIDCNYFYGEFLLQSNNLKAASQYFERAIAAPIRKEQAFADNQLKAEAKLALQNTKDRKIGSERNIFLSLFNSAEAE
ncbi:MAG: tetratricopeptide repeat protein [Methylococcaceae bacterium]|nr:tetratricopeptide repeat protein [Methylococcaceae bacterium]MDP3902718.1 tetratricopeptide repeat protein [Methylococcaceae bacterium]